MALVDFPCPSDDGLPDLRQRLTIADDPEPFTGRLDERGQRHSVLIGEGAPRLVRFATDSDVQVPPFHGESQYALRDLDECAPTSWLQQHAPNVTVLPLGEAVTGNQGEEGQTVARPTGDEALRAFNEYQRRRNLSPSTIKHRRFRLRALAGWLDKDILDATTTDLEKWLDHSELAPQTRYTYVAYLSAFYRWAVKERIIRVDPSEKMVRPKLPKRVPRPWGEEGMGHALSQADPRMACWLLMAHLAGARVMEMAALRVEDIHRDQSVILLHGKGNKERLVPLHPFLLDALTRFGLPRAGFVFRRRDGKPLQPTSISRYVGKFLRANGIDATAHQGRHAFATNAYRASEGDIRLVQDLMGHASPASTAIYAAWAPERSAKIVGQLTLPGT